MDVSSSPWFVHKVDQEERGLPLGALLRRHGFSGGILRRLRHERGIKLLLNGQTARTNQIAKAGDVVSCVYLWSPPKTIPEERPLSIVYEDAHLLVVDKEPGLLVHPVGRGMGDSLMNAVKGHLLKQGIPEPPHLIHRLDRETSGLIIIGKDPLSALGLHRQMEERTVDKQYLAVVQGELLSDSEISAPIAHAPDHPVKRQVDPDGRPALTRFQVLCRRQGSTGLLVTPVTGRTHQIRVHMAHVGHPVLGDELYGNPNSAPRLMLHCLQLRFQHPVSAKRLQVRSNMPPEFRPYCPKVQFGWIEGS